MEESLQRIKMSRNPVFNFSVLEVGIKLWARLENHCSIFYRREKSQHRDQVGTKDRPWRSDRSFGPVVSRDTRGADLCRDFDKHVSKCSVQNHRRPRARRAREKNLEKGMCKNIISS